MDICGACRHIRALHMGQTGNCRLNGCRCGGFELALLELERDPAPELEQVQAESLGPDLVHLITVALAFVAGVVVGCQL